MFINGLLTYGLGSSTITIVLFLSASLLGGLGAGGLILTIFLGFFFEGDIPSSITMFLSLSFNLIGGEPCLGEAYFHFHLPYKSLNEKIFP